MGGSGHMEIVQADREALLTIQSTKVEKKKSNNFLAAIGNFNIQYNFGCLGIAVSIMTTQGDDMNGAQPDFPEPKWAKFVLLGLVFAGAVAGMLCMGRLGDVIGRRRAMIITFSCVFVGALGSSIFTFGEVSTVYAILACCRLLLGIGVGGIYPLSAAHAFEGASKGEDEATRVGWAFFWQSPGSMAPYLVAWALVQLPRSENITSVQFRLILGIGALLAAIPLIDLLRNREEVEHVKPVSKQESPITILRNNKKYAWTLLGTAGSWFLYDISYYGSVIFTPSILADILGKENSLNDLCWQSLVVGVMAIPANASAIMLLKRKGPRWLNVYGFIFLAVCFGSLAITYNVHPEGSSGIKFAIFCITSFALSWGPNVSTYVMPTVCFPSSVRTTFHGLSAAGGKIGAVIGTFMYEPISQRYGLAAVMWVQVALSLLGTLVCVFFLPKQTEEEHVKVEDDMEEPLRSSI